jgi:hypothetical protein
MSRPQIDDETAERLESVVESRTKVPVSHLTTTQRIAFILDELAEADSRVTALTSKVESLEEELEKERSDNGLAGSDVDPVGGLERLNPTGRDPGSNRF